MRSKKPKGDDLLDEVFFAERVGSGSGSGSGYGSGSGDGDGDGSGYGYGSGYGSGDGYGSGYGLKHFCGEDVHYIDSIPTVIHSIRGNIARGYTINKDLTVTQCYIAKVGNFFAHGKTVRKAVESATAKHLQDTPIEERIEQFKSKFEGKGKISAKDLYNWHFILTGSCEFGRDEFVKQKGIDLNNDAFTIKEFINLTKNSYRGEIIEKLL